MRKTLVLAGAMFAMVAVCLPVHSSAEDLAKFNAASGPSAMSASEMFADWFDGALEVSIEDERFTCVPQNGDQAYFVVCLADCCRSYPISWTGDSACHHAAGKCGLATACEFFGLVE